VKALKRKLALGMILTSILGLSFYAGTLQGASDNDVNHSAISQASALPTTGTQGMGGIPLPSQYVMPSAANFWLEPAPTLRAAYHNAALNWNILEFYINNDDGNNRIPTEQITIRRNGLPIQGLLRQTRPGFYYTFTDTEIKQGKYEYTIEYPNSDSQIVHLASPAAEILIGKNNDNMKPIENISKVDSSYRYPQINKLHYEAQKAIITVSHEEGGPALKLFDVDISNSAHPDLAVALEDLSDGRYTLVFQIVKGQNANDFVGLMAYTLELRNK